MTEAETRGQKCATPGGDRAQGDNENDRIPPQSTRKRASRQRGKRRRVRRIGPRQAVGLVVDWAAISRDHGGYFQMPRAILDGGRIAQAGPIGLAVYVALSRHANASGECWPGQELIASEVGTSERSVRRAVGKLEALGLVTVTPTRVNADGELGDKGERLSNLYTLSYPEAAVCPAQVPDRESGTYRTESPVPQPEVPDRESGEDTQGLTTGKIPKAKGGGCLTNGSQGTSAARTSHGNTPPEQDRHTTGPKPSRGRNGHRAPEDSAEPEPDAKLDAEQRAVLETAIYAICGPRADRAEVRKAARRLGPDAIPELVADRDRMVPDGFAPPYYPKQLPAWYDGALATAHATLESDGLEVRQDSQRAWLRMTRAGDLEAVDSAGRYRRVDASEARELADTSTEPAWRVRLFFDRAQARREMDADKRPALAERPPVSF